MMAAFDLLEIYCELIAARLPIIESQKYVMLIITSDLQLLQLVVSCIIQLFCAFVILACSDTNTSGFQMKFTAGKKERNCLILLLFFFLSFVGESGSMGRTH